MTDRLLSLLYSKKASKQLAKDVIELEDINSITLNDNELSNHLEAIDYSYNHTEVFI